MKKVRIKNSLIVGYFAGYTDVNHTTAKVLVNGVVMHYESNELTEVVTVGQWIAKQYQNICKVRKAIKSPFEKLSEDEAEAYINTILTIVFFGGIAFLVYLISLF